MLRRKKSRASDNKDDVECEISALPGRRRDGRNLAETLTSDACAGDRAGVTMFVQERCMQLVNWTLQIR